MRDRLAEIYHKIEVEYLDYLTNIAERAVNDDIEDKIQKRQDFYVDKLLENGVIVLPKLQFRQTVYFIYNGKIHPLEVTSYAIRPEFGNMLQIHLYKNGFNGCCTVDDFGKTVFFSREEAIQALIGGGDE